MSGVLRLSNNVTGRSTIIASASNDQTFTLPAIGGTLLAGGSSLEVIFPPGTEALPGLHVQGDIDTGLYAPAANTLAISTDGSERLRVDSSGRVGIGDKSPGSFSSGANTLVVGTVSGNAGITINNGAADQIGSIFFAEGTGANGPGRIRYEHANNAMAFSTLNGERMRIDNSGNVGIGASVLASSSRLTLFEDTGNAQTLEIIAANAGGVGSQPGIKFTNNTGGNLGGIYGEVSSASVNLQTGGTVRMRIDSSGNVGINCTDPQTPLEISTSSADYRIQFSHEGGQNYIKSFDSNHSTYRLLGFDSATYLFDINGTEQMRIDGSGRLLLGTTTEGVSGGDQFTIGVAGNNNAGMTIRSGTSTRGAIYFADGTSGTDEYQGFIEYLQGSSGYMRFGTTAVERMRIQSNGRVLIGKTATNFAVQGIELRENGEIVCTRQGDIITTRRLNTEGTHISFRNVSGTYVGTIVTTSSSTAYNESSDYRLKENVVDITDGITRVKQLQPRRFNFIADADTTVDGFLAHEAHTVVPEAVTGTKDEVDDDGNAVMQGIDKSKLVPLLTAALQEAIAKIENLEIEVASLRSK